MLGQHYLTLIINSSSPPHSTPLLLQQNWFCCDGVQSSLLAASSSSRASYRATSNCAHARTQGDTRPFPNPHGDTRPFRPTTHKRTATHALCFSAVFWCQATHDVHGDTRPLLLGSISGARRHTPPPSTHGNTCLSASSCQQLWQHTDLSAPLLLLPQRSSLLLAAIPSTQRSLLALSCGNFRSSSDLRSFGNPRSRSLVMSWPIPSSRGPLPLSGCRSISNSGPLALLYIAGLSPRSLDLSSCCTLRVGPAADWRAVDPTAATKCNGPER